MSRLAFSQGRAVAIAFDDGTVIDAYKAAINKVEEMEGQFRDGTLTTDLSDTIVVLTGTSKYQIHVFSVTTNLVNGVYNFEFVETVPNVDEMS